MTGKALTDRYRELIIEWVSEPRVRVGNQLVNETQKEFLELRKTAQGRGALLELLGDEVRQVRHRAAMHALSFAPELAVPVLVQLTEGTDMVASNAARTLENHRNGKSLGQWEPAPPRSRSKRRRPGPAVSGSDLDAAIEVNGLIMNGGLFHSWQMDPAQVDAAAATIAAVGREDAAAILREASALFRSVDGDLTRDEDLLDEAGWERESDLSSAYYAVPDPQDDLERVLPDDES